MESSDENDTNQDSEIIGWKEHFDGKSGEKVDILFTHFKKNSFSATLIKVKIS